MEKNRIFDAASSFNKLWNTKVLWEFTDVGTHWIALFCNRIEIISFHSFGVEHFPEEIKEFVGKKKT